MRPLATLLACAALWCAAESSSAADALVWPCEQGSRERSDLQKRLDSLDASIRALKPDSDHAAANDALIAISVHPCLALSRVTADQLRAEAPAALIEFWGRGGRLWIEDHLRVESAGLLTFPPLMRKVITPQTRPDHPAMSLLCPAGDTRCGQETAGWWQRAESWFQLMATPTPRPNTSRDPNRALATLFGRPVPNTDSCREEGLAEPAGLRYGVWEACMQASRSVGFAMPLGRLKAPDSGWLVIRGRRGHYSFCDEVRMYSPATGAAYVSQGCSALFLGTDQKPSRNWKVMRGSMSVENTREALWMLLQIGEAAEGYRDWESFFIPAGFVPAWKPDEFRNMPAHLEAEKIRVVNSGQTTLAWDWIGSAGQSIVSGTLLWPDDYARGGPGDHAVALLQAAEGGFVEGCPGERPPQEIGLGAAKPKVSPIDANPRELSETERELMAELHKAARAECRAPR